MRKSSFLFFIAIPFLFSSVSFGASDSIPLMSRRQFIGRSACSFLLLDFLRGDGVEQSLHHRWTIHPESDIETLGLETFGDSVKAILAENGLVPDSHLAEDIRWKLQDKLWQLLEPKTNPVSAAVVKKTIAIAIGGGKYLYLEPSFRVSPSSPGSPQERTVGKIEYLSDFADPRVLTYWTAEEPQDSATIVISGKSGS